MGLLDWLFWLVISIVFALIFSAFYNSYTRARLAHVPDYQPPDFKWVFWAHFVLFFGGVVVFVIFYAPFLYP